jgi:hypothetical protein
VTLSSYGGQGIIDSTAEGLRTWLVEREAREAEAVGDALASGDGGSELRVEIAMDTDRVQTRNHDGKTVY